MKWAYDGALPPEYLLTDANLHTLFSRIWVLNNKPSIKQAIAYVNWCLYKYKQNKMLNQRNKFGMTLNFIGSIKKTKKWTDHLPEGARSLTEAEVRGLGSSPVKNEKGEVVLQWVRDKLIAMTEIHAGYHPADVHRMTTDNLKFFPNHKDRRGWKKPYVGIVGLKTKDRSQNTFNFYCCGCGNSDHNANNWNCEYTLINHLITKLPEDLGKKALWWNTWKKGFEWSLKQGPMQKRNISQAIQRINERCNISPEKLSGNQGRKTMITLGRNLFGYDDELLKSVSHHDDHKSYLTYVDPYYQNIQRMTLLSEDFQDMEQGRYQPLIVDCLPRHITVIRDQTNQIVTKQNMTYDITNENHKTLEELVKQVKKVVALIHFLIKMIYLVWRNELE